VKPNVREFCRVLAEQAERRPYLIWYVSVPVRLVRNHEDVVAFAVGLLWIDILVELVNQAENVRMVFVQQSLEIIARCGARRFLASYAAAGEGPVNSTTLTP